MLSREQWDSLCRYPILYCNDCLSTPSTPRNYSRGDYSVKQIFVKQNNRRANNSTECSLNCHYKISFKIY